MRFESLDYGVMGGKIIRASFHGPSQWMLVTPGKNLNCSVSPSENSYARIEKDLVKSVGVVVLAGMDDDPPPRVRSIPGPIEMKKPISIF